jgi:hypothetical protein
MTVVHSSGVSGFGAASAVIVIVAAPSAYNSFVYREFMAVLLDPRAVMARGNCAGYRRLALSSIAGLVTAAAARPDAAGLDDLIV